MGMKKLLRSVVFTLGFLGTAAMAANPANIPVVQNIAGLKALGAAAPQYPDVNVLGYYTANDGGGGLVHWNAASTATQDNAYVFQATGVSTGRYFWNLGGKPINVLQCGVKADASTNNTTQFQACFTAMGTYSLGEISCPPVTQSINFVGPITPVGGASFRGVNNNQATYLNQSAVGTCLLNHTGTGLAFDFQTPFQSVSACPSVPGPRFYNFSLQEASTGNSIRVNNASTAGFSDDCVATGGGQSQVFGTVIDNVTFTSSQRGTTAVELNKAFDSLVTNNTFSFYDTQVQIKGSDNVEIARNFFNYATLREVDLISSGTFGNYNNIRDNTFFSPYINATDFIRSGARSGVIDGNYFEADYSGITSVLNLTCNLSQTVTNNTMALLPVNVAYWLKVTGDCTQITLTNNYPLGGGTVPSIWNTSTGSSWFASGGVTKQKIFAWGNPDDSLQTPYVTREPVPALSNQPNNYTGALLGTFDSSTTANLGGNYATSIKIGPTGFAGAFAFAAVAAAGGHVTFKFIPRVAGNVDFTIYANTSGATNQQITCTDGVTTTTMTIAGGTQKRWYTFSAAGGDVVDDPTIDCYNNDTGHNQTVYVYKWAANLH